MLLQDENPMGKIPYQTIQLDRAGHLSRGHILGTDCCWGRFMACRLRQAAWCGRTPTAAQACLGHLSSQRHSRASSSTAAAVRTGVLVMWTSVRAAQVHEVRHRTVPVAASRRPWARSQPRQHTRVALEHSGSLSAYSERTLNVRHHKKSLGPSDGTEVTLCGPHYNTLRKLERNPVPFALEGGARENDIVVLWCWR